MSRHMARPLGLALGVLVLAPGPSLTGMQGALASGPETSAADDPDEEVSDEAPDGPKSTKGGWLERTLAAKPPVPKSLLDTPVVGFLVRGSYVLVGLKALGLVAALWIIGFLIRLRRGPTAQQMVARADKLARQGRHEEAGDLCEKRGSLFIALGHYEQAGARLKAARAALRLGKHERAYNHFLAAGHRKAALRCLEEMEDKSRLLEIYERSKEPGDWEKAGEILFKQGNHVEAAKQFRRAKAYERAAVAMEQTGDTEDLEQAATLWEIAVNVAIGRVEEADGDDVRARARAELHRLVKLGARAYEELALPEKAAALYERANLHADAARVKETLLRDHEGAAHHYRQAGEIEKAAEALERAGRTRSARMLLADKASEEGDDATAGALLDAAGEHEAAAERFRRLIDGRPVDAETVEYYYRLGAALYDGGKSEEALVAFRAIDENYPGYRDSLGRVRQIEEESLSTRRPVIARAGAQAEVPPGEDATVAGVPRATKGSAPPPPTSLQEHRYRIIRELGRGGMGVVVYARDTELERDVALKFLADDLVANPMALKYFKREARASASLNHRNIVQVYDVGRLQNRPFICMEFVRGRTVEDLLNDKGKPLLAESVRIAYQMCDALHYAHGRNIIHRDIKPANVMLTEEAQEVKLMDFGLAKVMESGQATTVVSGTPAFMAPEQFVGKGLDARTDLFALGVMLYLMLSGQTPFEGARRDVPARPLLDIVSDLPPPLAALVEWMIHFDRDERPPSALTVLKKLASIAAMLSTMHRAEEPQGRP